MNAIVTRVVEGTFAAILLFWVLNNAQGFSAVTKASADAVTGGFGALVRVAGPVGR